MAAAIAETLPSRHDEESRLRSLRDELIERIGSGVDGAQLSGSHEARLANNVHFRFDCCSSADLLYLLDETGISVSAGSACQAGVERASHVLLAMGFSEAEASSPLRITLGHGTSSADIDEFASALPEAVAKARLARGR
jgi:cysteine desulfurase